MKLIRKAGTMSISDIIEYVKEVQDYKISIQDYLDIWRCGIGMVYFKATKDVNGIIFQDERARSGRR